MPCMWRVELWTWRTLVWVTMPSSENARLESRMTHRGRSVQRFHKSQLTERKNRASWGDPSDLSPFSLWFLNQWRAVWSSYHIWAPPARLISRPLILLLLKVVFLPLSRQMADGLKDVQQLQLTPVEPYNIEPCTELAPLQCSNAGSTVGVATAPCHRSEYPENTRIALGSIALNATRCGFLQRWRSCAIPFDP